VNSRIVDPAALDAAPMSRLIRTFVAATALFNEKDF
jgi:hypothetical protein